LKKEFYVTDFAGPGIADALYLLMLYRNCRVLLNEYNATAFGFYTYYKTGKFRMLAKAMAIGNKVYLAGIVLTKEVIRRSNIATQNYKQLKLFYQVYLVVIFINETSRWYTF
jgi:hypothetical protein